jgi:isopropylmalate/homocitrate/citramalate synthase
MLPARVQVVEVGPRDGLQNEPVSIPPAEKIAFVNRLTDAGHSAIEIAAFVSSRWVPQMADSAEVCAGITRREGVRYSALVPNLTGLRRAREAQVEEIAIFAAASQTFSHRNINQSISESLASYAGVCEEALAAGLRIRAYLSVAFGCPFEGAVPASTVADLAARLVDMGAYQVALSDTIGVAHPKQVTDVVNTVTARIRVDQIALHLHDTRGTALVNVYAGLEGGVTTYDSSAGGLGGCPYAPGATGNLATEDLLYMLDGLGIETGVRLDGIVNASRAIEPLVGHPLPSRVFRAAIARPT